jgi:hypothetical protein
MNAKPGQSRSQAAKVESGEAAKSTKPPATAGTGSALAV